MHLFPHLRDKVKDEIVELWNPQSIYDGTARFSPEAITRIKVFFFLLSENMYLGNVSILHSNLFSVFARVVKSARCKLVLILMGIVTSVVSERG